MFPRYTQNMLKVSPKYTKDISQIWPRYAQIRPRYGRNMPKICQNLRKMDPRDASTTRNDNLLIIISIMSMHITVGSMLAGCYHEGSDKHHVGLFQIGEANLEKNVLHLPKIDTLTRSRSSYTISSTWYMDNWT